MKLEQQINNQIRVIKKIYNNEKGIFSWDDMIDAIEALLAMERLRIDPKYFDEKEE